MNRIARFVRNVGWRGTLRSALIAIFFLFFLIFAKSREVELAIAAPIAIAGFFLVYPFRDLLVGNLRGTRIALGVSAILIVGTAIVLGKVMKAVPRENPWIVTALMGVAGIYMGAYFWVHSDPRVDRVDE